MKYRRAAKVDANQPEIVAILRDVPGVTVQTGMDDILVGHQGRTYWFEIKEPRTLSKTTGEILEAEIKPSQKLLRATWAGHYRIVTNVDEILQEIGVIL